MKKCISKSIIALILCFSLVITTPVKQADAAVGTLIGGASLVLQLLSMLSNGISNATERDNARLTIMHQFSITSLPTWSSSRYTRISADQLSSICTAFNQQGLPCAIVDATVGGNAIRVLRCTGEPFSIINGSPILGTYTLTNRYYAPENSTVSNSARVLYAVGDDSAYSLSFIRSTVNTIATTCSTISTYLSGTIGPRLQLIIGYIDNLETYVASVVSFVSDQATQLSSIVTNTSNTVTNTDNIYSRLGDILSVVRKNYYFGYKSDTNNVDYPTIPISWDTANSICSYLNNNFNHDGTINYISVSNQVGAQYTFYHARVASSGYIVVNVYEGGSAHDFVVCDRNHNCYMASDAASYDHISTSLSSIIGYVDGVESTLNTISSRVNTTNTRLNTVNSTLTSIGDKIDNIEIPEPIDYTDALSQIIGNTTDEIYVTLYTDDSNGNQYSTLSYRPEIIDGIISYLTTNMQNKPLKVLSRDGTAGVVSQEVRYFMLANFNNGYIRLRVKLENDTYGFAYLSTPNRVLIKYDATYVDDTTFMNTVVNAINSVRLDSDGIVDAIDRIYEWLDNADLATNATIVQVVQDYSSDVDNSVDWASQILDLFRDVFVFDRPAPSFSGVLQYFSQLGSDPTE